MELKVDVRLDVTLLQRTFNQLYANEPSSPAPVATPVPRGSRTTQLLRVAEQQEIRQTSAELISSIHERWTCKEGHCNNFGQWCFVTPQNEHFSICPADLETWAKRIIEGQGGALIEQPPYERVTSSKSILIPVEARARRDDQPILIARRMRRGGVESVWRSSSWSVRSKGLQTTRRSERTYGNNVEKRRSVSVGRDSYKRRTNFEF